MENEQYDVIIIGSGMGGLSAGALLAKAGKKVLVVERHDRPGGCAQTFRRKKYLFDAAVHLICGCIQGETANDGLIAHLLHLLGVKETCNFIKVDPFYTAVFPDRSFAIPLGKEEYIDACVQYFPSEREGIRQFVELASSVAKIVRKLPTALTQKDAFVLAKRYPDIIKYQTVTFKSVMEKYLTNQRLMDLISSFWPYAGLPPSRLPFLYAAMILMNYIEEGAFHCQGSFGNLVNAFIEALRANDGELMLMQSVKSIVLSDLKVSGVLLNNGRQMNAPIVISNADLLHTCKDLIGFERLPRHYVDRISGMKPSISTFVVYMATKMDFNKHNAGHEIICFPSWDHDSNYREILQGRPGAPIVTIPSLSDPTLSPDGEHLVNITLILPHDCVDSWREEKSRCIDMLMFEMDKLFPEFRDHVTYFEGASPQTIQRYTQNHFGAMYGWEASRDQTGSRRPGHFTPIQGLYLSGHWVQPGGGIYSVIQSGVQTAQIILGHQCVDDLFKELM